MCSLILIIFAKSTARFLEYEIEPAGIASVHYPHQQSALEQAVTNVRRLVGKIELCGQ